MPETTSQQINPVEKYLKECYYLYYIKGPSPTPQPIMFHFPKGSFRDAVTASKKYCEDNGIRWISVRPCFVDFAETEDSNNAKT